MRMPITLVRLIVAGNSSKELPIVNTIFILSIVSATIATIMGILTGDINEKHYRIISIVVIAFLLVFLLWQ
ncbi:MAG: hypothetical protein Ct9H300mP24_8410 [Candidatus Neomarinimicrobiota bacterium]|nr:MAG: hypothetical protein Ct9H300mP24_8410 [Candidatus Neomarinimicrobiota bacterium]